MTKYHISPKDGKPSVCNATVRPCPIGGENVHYGSKEEARGAYESKMVDQTFTPVNKSEITKKENDYVKSLATYLSNNAGKNFTKGQSEFLSKKVFDLVGIERFEKEGVTPESINKTGDIGDIALDKKSANDLYDAYAECGIDMHKNTKDQIVASFSRALGRDINKEEMNRVDNVLTKEKTKAVFVSTIMDEDSDINLTEEVKKCFPSDFLK